MTRCTWTRTPRSFGNPKQTMVYDPKYLMCLINENNGVNPVFVSHNRFPDVDRFENPVTIEVSRIFKDLDNEKKPENALLDLRRLARFAEENGIDYEASYSGSKGFHFFHMLQPNTYQITQKLESAMRSVQLWWCGLGEYSDGAYKKKLRCDDEHIYGDWRRLVRFPGSIYAKWIPEQQTSVTNGRCCISMTREMIFDWPMDRILDRATQPFIRRPKEYPEALTLKQFIKKFDVKESIYYTSDNSATAFADLHHGHDKILQKQFRDPCLYNALMSDNPSHMARFAITVYCKDVLKFNVEQTFQLMQSRNWVDSHNINTCKEQINHIYRKGYHLSCTRANRCQWFKEKGLCIGGGCGLFKT